MKYKKLLAIIISITMCLTLLSSCSSAATAIADSSVSSSGTTSFGTTSDATSPDNADAQITLNGSSVKISGSGVSANKSIITITSGGSYCFSGTLSDGRIIVNVKGKKVNIILNSASITCSYGSPIYVYNTSCATITLASGTTNTITDGSSYTFIDSLSSSVNDEPNACIYSKSDLIVNGSGKLIVNANYKNGITSKDTLNISDSTVVVTAVSNGINGKDSNTISNAKITVSCGGDAVRSTNDTDAALGCISVINSTLSLTAGEDGIQADANITIKGGTYTIKSGGGSSTTPSDTISSKGIKAGGDISISSGTFDVNSSDDALHSTGSISISGGIFSLSTGDDGAHADKTLTVSGGKITVSKSYEGFEGSIIKISGGSAYITASDDGFNAAGGSDSSQAGGFGGNDSFSANSDYYIEITGGYIYINSSGDGLDSNGNITMTAGTAIVSGPTANDNGAIDYNGSFTFKGGYLLAAGSSGMAQAPDDLTQYTLSITFNQTLSVGTYVKISNSSSSYVFKVTKATQNLVFSCPDLKKGNTYTVSYGGSYSGGKTVDGICTGGSYSGGTTLTSITVSSYITTYGTVGTGGSRGGNFISPRKQ